METIPQKKGRAVKIIARLKQAYPDARLALDFSSPLELLIALILAAQARDDRVNLVTAGLFKKYRAVADWAAVPAGTLQKEISQITFFRNKTRSIQGACRMLGEKFGGVVPDSLEDLLTLPGVGRKTANVLLGNAFGRAVIGVDRHVARVSGRLELTRQTDPDLIEEDLMKVVPENDRVKFCHLFQHHGRRVCVAKNPKCSVCPVNSLCPYPDKSGYMDGPK
jgi:endonuclease III